MNINFSNQNLMIKQVNNVEKQSYNYNKISSLSQLKTDTVSFSGSLKLDDVSDFTKSLIKKLGYNKKRSSTMRHFNIWANDTLKKEFAETDFWGAHQETNILRDNILQPWRKHLIDDKAYDGATSLWIMRSITKPFRIGFSNDYALPPVLNTKVLAEVVSDYKNSGVIKKSFADEYVDKFYEHKWTKEKIKWGKMESDEILSSISDKNATMYYRINSARKCYGKDNDILVMTKNGEPINYIMVKGKEVVSSFVESEYLDDVMAKVKSNGLSLSQTTRDLLTSMRIRKNADTVIKKEISDWVKNNDYESILNYLGIDINRKDTLWRVKYGQYLPGDVKWEDYGINSKKMVEYIESISGDN